MPSYSDNLYSADDTDADADVRSFSDELSPTDGYFTNSTPARGHMVPDPSLQTRNDADAAKAREAAEERRATSAPLRISTQGPSTVFNTPRSAAAVTSRLPTSPQGRRADLYSETSSLLHAGIPPPAYSPSTVQPVDQSFDRSYNTIPVRRLEDGIREPERMGPPDEFNERTPLWMRRVRKAPRRKVIQNVLFAALIFVVAAFIIAMAKARKSSDGSGPDPIKSPSTGPGGSGGPYCRLSNMIHVNESPTYEFSSGGGLSVFQLSGFEGGSGNGRGRVRTAGEVIVRRLPEDKEDQETGYITFDVWISDDEISYKTEMDGESQTLQVSTPKYAEISPIKDHCISIEITVWVPPNANFQGTLIQTTELSVKVMDDVDCQVTGEAQLRSISGSITFPTVNESILQSSKSESSLLSGDSLGFSADQISAETTSGSVRGTFKLYNNLVIKTQSGSVDISVEPQPSSGDKPQPAIFNVATASGSVWARFPIRYPNAVPDRNYYSYVTTHSGSIRGDYLLGTEATFKGISGSMQITALPTTYDTCTFSTSTHSGSTKILVLPPHHQKQSSSSPPSQPVKHIDVGDNDPYLISESLAPLSTAIAASALTHLKSTHQDNSGSFKIQYPSVWEGEINAQTVSGSIKVGGDDVSIIEDGRKYYAFRKVVARKGADAEHASRIDISGVSGSIDLWIGDDAW